MELVHLSYLSGLLYCPGTNAKFLIKMGKIAAVCVWHKTQCYENSSRTVEPYSKEGRREEILEHALLVHHIVRKKILV